MGAFCVLPAINLDDEALFATDEVNNVTGNAFLSDKFVSRKPPVT